MFGTYIHTYKFAVADKVVLDLKYEARDGAATPGSRQRPSTKWFEQKTNRA